MVSPSPEWNSGAITWPYGCGIRLRVAWWSSFFLGRIWPLPALIFFAVFLLPTVFFGSPQVSSKLRWSESLLGIGQNGRVLVLGEEGFLRGW